MKRIISFIVIFCFVINSIAFALSPSPGTGTSNTQSAMTVLAQKQADPQVIDFDSALEELLSSQKVVKVLFSDDPGKTNDLSSKEHQS
jgi:hypothetical protein